MKKAGTYFQEFTKSLYEELLTQQNLTEITKFEAKATARAIVNDILNDGCEFIGSKKLI